MDENEAYQMSHTAEQFRLAVEKLLGNDVLPAVSETDNGKMLSVINGAWALE